MFEKKKLKKNRIEIWTTKKAINDNGGLMRKIFKDCNGHRCHLLVCTWLSYEMNEFFFFSFPDQTIELSENLLKSCESFLLFFLLVPLIDFKQLIDQSNDRSIDFQSVFNQNYKKKKLIRNGNNLIFDVTCWTIELPKNFKFFNPRIAFDSSILKQNNEWMNWK